MNYDVYFSLQEVPALSKGDMREFDKISGNVFFDIGGKHGGFILCRANLSENQLDELHPFFNAKGFNLKMCGVFCPDGCRYGKTMSVDDEGVKTFTDILDNDGTPIKNKWEPIGS